ncbi:MAG TPA: hypothetical protein VGI66_10230 [Streptosporangiaceae bacterium]
MSGEPALEQRYRRVLRLLPGWYREQWEQDMVAAFLDSWLTGDAYTDECVLEFCKPAWTEVASVILLAARLYLGGAGVPRRYFAWGQAVRGAVLAVLLFHTVRGLDELRVVFLARGRHAFGIGITPPAAMVRVPGVVWPAAVWYVAGYAWIVVFVVLVLGYYRAARVLAVLAVVPELVWLAQGQLAGALLSPFGSWAHWFLFGPAPVLAMAAFHRDAPPVARRPWLLALPATYLLVAVPELAAEATGHQAWVPDLPGLCCVLVTVLCLTRAPRALSRRSAGTGVWSLTLVLLAAVAVAYRIASLGDYLQGHYLQDPHLINVGLAELLILVAAAALIAPDGARAQTAMPAPTPRQQPG